MIGITIDCRLGNQLFQYAFAKTLAEQLGTGFYANEQLARFLAADYFDLKGYHRLTNPIKRLAFKLTHAQPLQPLQSIPVGDFDETFISELTDGEIYRGYFQSALFFKDIAATIGDYIRVKKKFQRKFQLTYRNLFAGNRVIVVHVRRGDYLHLNYWWQKNLGSSDLSLPLSYYQNCLKNVELGENDKLVFVSDDMEYVRSEFAYLPNSMFVQNDAITDFQLIMHADICIIANSSFAWWAAYLNPKKNKQVLCPQYWLGFKISMEYPANIIPPEWTQIAVHADQT